MNSFRLAAITARNSGRYLIALTPPGEPDSVTIKVREKSTGAIKSVTATDERRAIAKLAVGAFD